MRPLMRPLPLPTLLSALSLLAGACGGTTDNPDAGPQVDTSCGIDCVVQAEYGLIANRCFEYSDDSSVATPPDLGVAIEGLVELEGGQKALRAVYFQNGQRLIEDTFLLVDGDLKLARRSDNRASRSITYTDEGDLTVGVTLVQADTAVGQSFPAESVTAVIAAGASSEEATTWTGNTFPPTASEKTTPSGAYENAVTITYNETPDHGLDPRRVFVRGTGFVQLNTRLSLTPSDAAAPYKLQGMRELTAETLSNCGSAL